MAQRRPSEAEVEMDMKSWERRNTDMARYETNRQLESQQMELYHANEWASQAQMEHRRIINDEEQTLSRKSLQRLLRHRRNTDKTR